VRHAKGILYIEAYKPFAALDYLIDKHKITMTAHKSAIQKPVILILCMALPKFLPNAAKLINEYGNFQQPQNCLYLS
jgi:hypothetical protein